MSKEFNALFYPKSVCLIGSSRIRERGNLVSHTVFRNIMNNLRTFYKGKLHVVDISKSTDFPKADLYVVTLPEEETFAHLKNFNCKFCILLAGNFTQKTLLSQRMKEKGIRFLGPNSVGGIVNTNNGLNTTFERGVMPKKGDASFVVQSGGVGASILDYSHADVFGVGKLVWIGNAWDIGFNELLEYLSKDKNTKSVGIYIEGIEDGSGFVETVKGIKKPIIALKGGVTEESKERAMTHTSSLAGSPEIYSSVFKQLGIVEVEGLAEFFESTSFLSGVKPMRGDRVAIVSNVGGPSILAADIIHKHGLKLSKLSEDTKSVIKSKYVMIESINPLDVIADAGKERFGFCLKQVLKDRNTDAVMVINMLKSCLLRADETKEIAKIIKRSKKPVVDCVPAREDWEEVRGVMGKEGVYVFDDLQRAAKALKAMHDYFMLKNKR